MKNSELAQLLFYLNGAPFHIDEVDMRHLLPIYNSESDALLMMNGRQTHKSTTCANLLMLPVLTIPGFNSLYVAPTFQQVSVFSTDKLKGMAMESPIIQDVFTDKHTVDQIGYKEYSNGSKVYLRSSYHSPDSSRGISSDRVEFDEMQDLILDHIPVIEQSAAHSMAKSHHIKKLYPMAPMHYFSSKVYAGTPKTLQNTLTVYWDKSSQNEWIIRCERCSKQNYLDEANVGIHSLICRYCGKPIYYDNGQWVAMVPKAPIDGFRMPQIAVNWVNDRNNANAWRKQVHNIRQVYSPEKFHNEVLALPYANARNPLSKNDIAKCCDSDWHNMEPTGPNKMILKNTPLFYGIDWGKGDTGYGTSYSQLFIGGFFENKFKIIYAKKYTGQLSDPLIQVKHMLDTIREYRCVFGLADTGDGRTSNALMVGGLGPKRFAEIYESSNLGQKLKWNADIGIYVMNRTQMMTDRFMEIKRGQVGLFSYEEFDHFVTDFLNIYIEYNERTRMTKYDHTGADDAFHAYMYCRIAGMIANGDMNKYILGATTSSSVTPSMEIGYQY